MAISFAGWLTHWIIYFRFFLANRATVKQLQNNVQKTYESENAPEVLPSKITSNTALSIKREVLEAQQKWELFHVRPKTGQEKKKVVVYWHGGAFFKRVSPFYLIQE
jgi:acetyl esterase/lipase